MYLQMMIHPTDAIRMVNEEKTRYYSAQWVLMQANEPQYSLLERITNRFMPTHSAKVAAVASQTTGRVQISACCSA